MKRKIKFRGKRLDNGEWTYGNLIRVEDRCAMVGYTDLDAAFEVDPATVGQFTGLHDKVGREIYEGDIFETTDSNGSCLVVVEWDSVDARFLGRDQRKRIWYVGREPVAEIIGNIHDNPEFLN